jgi:hypothetical protein
VLQASEHHPSPDWTDLDNTTSPRRSSPRLRADAASVPESRLVLMDLVRNIFQVEHSCRGAADSALLTVSDGEV